MKPTTYQFAPLGPFDLLFQNQFFNGWQVLGDGQTIIMAFPVEGWQSSAAVALSQSDKDPVELTVYSDGDPEAAHNQALAVLSLDVGVAV